MASTVSIPELPALRLVLLRLGERVFGIDLSVVREIIPFRRATRLPGAPAHVAGLINVRGSIITVVDLGMRLGLDSTAAPDASVVLVDHRSTVVGLAADEVLDVQRQGEGDGAIEAVMADGEVPGVLRALGRQGDNAVLVIDADAILRQILL